MRKNKKQITKKNFNKKILSILLTGTIALGFSGCGNSTQKQETQKLSLLENTLLEEAFIVNTDLGIMIATTYHAPLSPCEHYRDVITGLEFADKNRCGGCQLHQLNKVEKIGAINNYLTEEELIKANRNELTDEDIIAIVARIQTSEIDKQTEKKLTK